MEFLFLGKNSDHFIKCEGIKFRYLTFSLRVLPALNLTAFDAGQSDSINLVTARIRKSQGMLPQPLLRLLPTTYMY